MCPLRTGVIVWSLTFILLIRPTLLDSNACDIFNNITWVFHHSPLLIVIRHYLWYKGKKSLLWSLINNILVSRMAAGISLSLQPCDIQQPSHPTNISWLYGVGLPAGSGGIVAAGGGCQFMSSSLPADCWCHEEGWHRGGQSPLSSQ